MPDETPGDRLNRKLREQMEAARRNDEIAEPTPGKPEPSSPAIEPFIEPQTMYKLEERLPTAMAFNAEGRKAVCVNCGKKVYLDIYLEFQETLSKVCPACKMTSKEFYSAR